MENGYVLVMSEWDDGAAHMLWLDSNYPPDADPSKPGVSDEINNNINFIIIINININININNNNNINIIR